MSSPCAPIEIISQALARERKKAGLSLAEIARRAGIAKSTLSQLEAGQGNPSIETLWAICVALNIPFSQLISAPQPEVKVIRKGDGFKISAEKAYYHAFLLSSCPMGAKRDIYTVIAQPGKDRVSDPHSKNVTEHIIIISGSAMVGTLDDQEELQPGDYICYPGDVTHVLRALEPDTTAVMIIEHHN
ncbi:XRE family transcriptional regulator [Proteus terrae]|uniref:helix-turn-helix domain-containing protein n=1 Tax=Proteus terrae TaxID=1574161 RepID=UPI0021BB754D|nr:XRE family transcriptional regulator [Proteus terrae]MCT8263710.1 XRE family transcriptional regulator [Proteus terrae]